MDNRTSVGGLLLVVCGLGALYFILTKKIDISSPDIEKEPVPRTIDQTLPRLPPEYGGKKEAEWTPKPVGDTEWERTRQARLDCRGRGFIWDSVLKVCYTTSSIEIPEGLTPKPLTKFQQCTRLGGTWKSRGGGKCTLPDGSTL